MEALVILLAEFLTAFIVPALILAAELAILLLSLLIELICWLCFSKRKVRFHSKRAPTASPLRRWRDTVQSWSTISRPIRNGALIGLALTVGAMMLANTVFFEPTVRFILAMVGQRTGSELAFNTVSGNLLIGHFVFEELSAKRISDTASSFDLKAHKFSVNLDLPTLLARPIAFDSLMADTVTGTLQLPERHTGTGNTNSNNEVLIKAKRKFHIEALALTNVNIALSRGERTPVAVSLKSVASAPFRSNFAIFDVLFRSNLIGEIDGHDISISTKQTDTGRITQWRMPALPAESVSRFVTKPPIGWLRSGLLNISVDDRWSLGEQAEIDMNWSIRMEGVSAEVEETAGAVERMFAVPFVRYINSREGNVDLHFRLLMDENHFENMASLYAGALWDALRHSIAKAIAISSGEDPSNVTRSFDKAVKGFKGFLNKRRKPPTNE